MTEDMIQQQEELFETLGSSSDAAKMRAKMQSMQLISGTSCRDQLHLLFAVCGNC